MFELVIFDCDGVLVDSEPISCGVLAECLTELGLETGYEECLRDFGGRFWPDCLAIIESRLGRPVPDDFTADFTRRREAAFRRGVEPFAGVPELLAGLELPFCVASNGTIEKMRVTLSVSGLLEFFEGRIFSAHGLRRGKPAPDLFLHAAEQMGFEPGVCAVIEDTEVGVEAGRAAGMTVFGFAERGNGAELAAAGAHTFSAMGELPRLLRAGAALDN